MSAGYVRRSKEITWAGAGTSPEIALLRMQDVREEREFEFISVCPRLQQRTASLLTSIFQLSNRAWSRREPQKYIESTNPSCGLAEAILAYLR